MAEVHNTGILLESCSNENEITECPIQENHYGITVAKVREIMMAAPFKFMPPAHASGE